MKAGPIFGAGALCLLSSKLRTCKDNHAPPVFVRERHSWPQGHGNDSNIQEPLQRALPPPAPKAKRHIVI